jgi:hypothetical protein
VFRLLFEPGGLKTGSSPSSFSPGGRFVEVWLIGSSKLLERDWISFILSNAMWNML